MNATAALHARRAGWFSAHPLGTNLLDQACKLGVQLQKGRVVNIDVSNNCNKAVQLSDNSKISTSVFVNAAGPFAHKVGQLINLELPIFNELHLTVAFRDPHYSWFSPNQCTKQRLSKTIR